jgi:hypothetical protein
VNAVKKKIALGLAMASVAALAVPAVSSASSYTMSEHAAEHYAKQAAERRYERWGVTADAAACRPQGYSLSRRGYWKRYTWHRWVCVWGGTDEAGAEVFGGMRIDAHTDDTYGYRPLYGGLHWA